MREDFNADAYDRAWEELVEFNRAIRKYERRRNAAIIAGGAILILGLAVLSCILSA